MTTAHSPLRVLKAQADRMAAMLKAMERGEPLPVPDPAGKAAAARAAEAITFGIAMDDKIIKIEIAWATIRASSETGLAAYILKQMRQSRETTH